MSRAEDRIPVPTNGHRPPLAATSDADPPDDAVDPTLPVESRFGVGLDASPAQLAVGFGVIVWVIVVLLGRSRRRRG
jgi:hypothetical protein